MNIREKIDLRLHGLEESLAAGKYLDRPEDRLALISQINSVSKFWRILREADREFIQCAIFALQEERRWE